MTNTASLYWLTRLDFIHGLAFTSLVVGFMLTLIIIIGYIESRQRNQWYRDDDEIRKGKVRMNFYMKKLKLTIPIFVFGLLTTIFLPNKSDMIFIIAGGKSLDFIEQDTSISKIPGQTTAIVSKFLDEQLKDVDVNKEQK